MEKEENIKRYFFWAVLILLIYLCYLIVKPFLIAMTTGFILAYLAKPLYNKLNQRLNCKFSALLSVFLAILLIILPFSLVVGGIIQQSYSTLAEKNIPELIQKFSLTEISDKINLDLSSLLERGLSLITSLLTSTLVQLPTLLISILITLISMYYILIYWKDLAFALKTFIPVEDKEDLVKEIDKSTKSIVHGIFLIAFLEFIVGIIGFYLSGVEAYLLLPALIFLFAFIPGVGPIAVWGPLALYYLISQNYFTFTGVIVTGLIISFFIETFLISKIIGEKAKINPLIMLIGIVGGIPILGIFGVILGPLILNYTIKIISKMMNKK